MHRTLIAALIAASFAPLASAQVARGRAAKGGAPAEGPYAAQVSCHRSMGGAVERGQAVLPGTVDGAQGRFVFNANAFSFQAADGASSGAAALRALNAALVARARAVESIDPGSYNMSRCPELVPAPPPTDY